MTTLQSDTIIQMLTDVLATLHTHDETLTQHTKKFISIDERFIEIDKRFDDIDKRFDQLTKEMHAGFTRQEELSLEILNIIGRQMQEFELKVASRHTDHETRITKLERKVA